MGQRGRGFNYRSACYNFDIKYQIGSENISGFISRIKNLPKADFKVNKPELYEKKVSLTPVVVTGRYTNTQRL